MVELPLNLRLESICGACGRNCDPVRGVARKEYDLIVTKFRREEAKRWRDEKNEYGRKVVQTIFPACLLFINNCELISTFWASNFYSMIAC